jgi:hypothetical protein
MLTLPPFQSENKPNYILKLLKKGGKFGEDKIKTFSNEKIQIV